MKGGRDEAIKDQTEAIRSEPDCANAWNNRGNAWLEKGEYDKAVADLEEAIRLGPDNEDCHQIRERVLSLQSGEKNLLKILILKGREIRRRSCLHGFIGRQGGIPNECVAFHGDCSVDDSEDLQDKSVVFFFCRIIGRRSSG